MKPDSQIDNGQGQTSEGAPAPSGLPLPCLFVTTQTKALPQGRSALAKRAETVYLNLYATINRLGVNHGAFLTATFAENLVCRIEAQRRWNNMLRGLIKRRYPMFEFIAVPERQNRGAIHYHLAAFFGYDIRSGFDFSAYGLAQQAKRDGNMAEFKKWERVYLRSGNAAIHSVWDMFLAIGPNYGFGRIETLPIKTNAVGVSRYFGAYVAGEGSVRLQRDKGLRLVRYGLRRRVASGRWSWAYGKGAVWRLGCRLLGLVMCWSHEEMSLAMGAQGWFRSGKVIAALGLSYDRLLPLLGGLRDWSTPAMRRKYLGALLVYNQEGLNSPQGVLELLGVIPVGDDWAGDKVYSVSKESVLFKTMENHASGGREIPEFSPDEIEEIMYGYQFAECPF